MNLPDTVFTKILTTPNESVMLFSKLTLSRDYLSYKPSYQVLYYVQFENTSYLEPAVKDFTSLTKAHAFYNEQVMLFNKRNGF